MTSLISPDDYQMITCGNHTEEALSEEDVAMHSFANKFDVTLVAVVMAVVMIVVLGLCVNRSVELQRTKEARLKHVESMSETFELVREERWDDAQHEYSKAFYGKSRDLRSRLRYWEILVGQSYMDIGNKRNLEATLRESKILIGMKDIDSLGRKKIESTVFDLVMQRTVFLFGSENAKSEDVAELWEKWIDFLLVGVNQRNMPRLGCHFDDLLKCTATLCNLHAITGGTNAVGFLGAAIIRRCKVLMAKEDWGKAFLHFRIHLRLCSKDTESKREPGLYLTIWIQLAQKNIADRNFVADAFRIAITVLSMNDMENSEKAECLHLLFDLLTRRVMFIAPSASMSPSDWQMIQNIDAPFSARLEASSLWNQFSKACDASNVECSVFLETRNKRNAL